MAKHYESGRRIVAGDKVTYGNKPGRVVFLIEEASFLPGFPKDEWEYLGSGIGIELDDGTVFHLKDADEDLIPTPTGD